MHHPKTTHPVVRAAFGIAALVLIAFLANWLISLTSFGTKGADFTEDRVHTLSKGSKTILEKLDAPVTIRYYASRKNEALPRETKLFIRRIDDILKEYANLAPEGKLRVENLDPQPDTDAEDSANLDGIQTQNINQYENVSLGLAISCLEQNSRINIDPFDVQSLDEQETMFEYTLSRAIGEVIAVEKPIIGVMSALPLKGGPAQMPGQPPQQGWVIYQQLGQVFKVKDIELTATEIPSDIKVLLLIHPAGIAPETEFLIDQFLLKGGTLIAALDAYSFDAAATAQGNPMMGMGGGGIPTSSTLPTLLPAWNISFESSQTLADAKYRTILQGNRPGYSALSLPKEAMPDKDDVITKNLNDLFFILPGAITNQGNNGLASSTLVKSSVQAGLTDSMAASQFSPNVTFENRRAYDLVLRLSGKFKTAFPNGKPGKNPPDDEANAEKKDDKADEKKEAEPAKPAWLKEGISDSNVFIIADTDAFSNQGAYRIQNMGGMQAAMPYNGNSVLLLNIIDQAASSADLIGARSRASIRRPFTLIREMEANAENAMQDKQKELQSKLKAAQDRLTELTQSRDSSKDLRLSTAQEDEEKQFRAEVTDANKQIRELYKDLKREKDKLSARIIGLNLGVVPGLVLLAGIGIALFRRLSARAR